MDTDKYFKIFILILVVSSTIGTIITSISDANLTGGVSTIFNLLPLGLGIAILLVVFKTKGK